MVTAAPKMKNILLLSSALIANYYLKFFCSMQAVFKDETVMELGSGLITHKTRSKK